MPTLQTPHVLLLLRSWLEPRRGLLRRTPSFAFATLEGERFTLDLADPELVRREWSDAADVTVLTNARTLSDLVTGEFDPRRPRSEHLFMWSGDAAAWGELETLTKDATSARGAAIDHLRR